MNGKSIRNVLTLVALLALTVSLSSCNRGYGCPTWSAGDQAVDAVKVAIELVVRD